MANNVSVRVKSVEIDTPGGQPTSFTPKNNQVQISRGGFGDWDKEVYKYTRSVDRVTIDACPSKGEIEICISSDCGPTALASIPAEELRALKGSLYAAANILGIDID